MAEPTKRQLEMQLEALHQFCNKYARHELECGWVTMAGACTCGYDAQVRRLKELWALLWPDRDFKPADPLSPAPAPEGAK